MSVKANCGGLILDNATLKNVNKIITTADGSPSTGIVANCGGVLFDGAKFKKIGDTITDINATASDVDPIVVNCGGLVVDSNYFEVENGELKYVTPLTIVTWAEGTDEEIAAMLDAHYAGTIDIHDYWNVGDTRTVSLSAMAEDTAKGYEAHTAQSINMVLMDTTCTGFTLSGTNTTPAFIVGQKDGLLEMGQMNSSNTNEGGWGATLRRSWCQDVYRLAMPATLRPIFKQFNWQYVKSGEDGALLTATDYFALPPERTIFSSKSYSRAEEWALFNQWSYYETAANRIKHTGTSGSTSGWWGCSPCSGGDYGICSVGNDGSAAWSRANSSNLLAPFGCI